MTKKNKQLPKKTDKPKPPSITRDGNQFSVNLTREIGLSISGCQTDDASRKLSELVMNASADQSDGDLTVKQTEEYLAIMPELAPRDAFEGMLTNQMFLVFRQALHIFSLSNLDGNRGRSDIQDSLTNRYVKLMRLFNQQLEALDKHRRGGNQKMTVEHVHVHEGGQAIVGNINQGGGGKDEK
ncbi:MAG: hypothetical protein AB1Z38_06570 [Desulfotignum sp.]